MVNGQHDRRTGRLPAMDRHALLQAGFFFYMNFIFSIASPSINIQAPS